MDITHLTALQTGLAHETERLEACQSDVERAQRSVWVAQYQREIASEKLFLGLEPVDCSMSNAELLAALEA